MAKLDLIISDLRRRIREAGFRPGDMIPTQKELAQEMGVSVVTMGHAMRHLQEEGVIASIRGKGTIINGFPDAKKRNTIGVIVTNSTSDDPVLRRPIAALQEACEKAGRQLKTITCSGRQINRARLREWVKDVSGCVAFGSTRPELVNLIGSLGKPVVFHGEFYREGCPPWASQVTVSVETIASLCLQFLESLGHREILLVRSRGTSYLESLGVHFTSIAEELGCRLEQQTVPFETDGTEVADALQRDSFRPTALIVDGGMRASRVLHALTRCGIRVPEDISLLAINGVPEEFLITPHLSRVENHPRRLGEKLLLVLDEMIERNVVLREETLASLIWGKTCIPRPATMQKPGEQPPVSPLS